MARSAATVPLKAFVPDDKKASGKIPDEPGWQTGGAGGALECFHPLRGEMHLGVRAMVSIPGGANAMLAPAYGYPVAPLMPPADAVRHVWLYLRNFLEPGVGYADVQIESEHPMSWGTPFSTSLLEIRFVRAGVPWYGPILAATAAVPYEDRWLFYWSQMAVPETDDGSVYDALTEAWRAYRPGGQGSGAQPAAAQAQADATFKMVKDMNAARRPGAPG